MKILPEMGKAGREIVFIEIATGVFLKCSLANISHARQSKSETWERSQSKLRELNTHRSKLKVRSAEGLMKQRHCALLSTIANQNPKH